MMGNSSTVCSQHSEPETCHCETCHSLIKMCRQCFEEGHQGHMLVEDAIDAVQQTQDSDFEANAVLDAKIDSTINSQLNNEAAVLLIKDFEPELTSAPDVAPELELSDAEEKDIINEFQEETSDAPIDARPEVPVNINTGNQDFEETIGEPEPNGEEVTSLEQNQEDPRVPMGHKEESINESKTVSPRAEDCTPKQVMIPLHSRVQAHFSPAEMNTAIVKPPKRPPLFSARPKKEKSPPSSTSDGPAPPPPQPPTPLPPRSASATVPASSAYKSDSDLSSAVCPEPVMTTRRQTTSPSLHRVSTPQLVWWEYYAHLLQWGETHRDYNVPAGSMVTLESGSSVDLGLWLRRQKSFLGTMVDEKYDALTQLAESGKLWGGDANDLQAAASADEMVSEGSSVRPLGSKGGGKRKATEGKKSVDKSGAGRGGGSSALSRELMNLRDSDGFAAKRTKTEAAHPGLLSSIGPNKEQRRIEGREGGQASFGGVTSSGVSLKAPRASVSVAAGTNRGGGVAISDRSPAIRDSSSSAAPAAPARPTFPTLVRASTRLTESDREGFYTAAEETSDSQQLQYRHYHRSQHHGHSSHHSSHHHSQHNLVKHHLHYSEDEGVEEYGHYHYVAFAYAASDMPDASEIQIGVGCVEYTPNYEGDEVMIVLKTLLTPVDNKNFPDGLFVSDDQEGICIDNEAIVAKHLKVKREEGRDEDLYYLSDRSKRKIRDTNIYRRLYDRKH